MTDFDYLSTYNQTAEALANIEFLEPIVNLLAKVRKLGMDLLFPLSTQDKVLACIFVSAQLIDKPAAHREVIEMVMTMKDCMNYPELDIISKTKIRGMLAFLKHSEILVPYVHGNDPVKLQLSPTVPNFQILREKHDLFMFKFLVRNRVAIPKHLLGQVLWEPSRSRSGADGRLHLINQFIVSLRNMMMRQEFDPATGLIKPKYVKVLASVPEKFERAVDSLPVIETEYGGFKSYRNLNNLDRRSILSSGQFYEAFATVVPQSRNRFFSHSNKKSPRSMTCDGQNTNYKSRPSSRHNDQLNPTSHHSVASQYSHRTCSVSDPPMRDGAIVQSRDMYHEQNYQFASSSIQNTSCRLSSSNPTSSHHNYPNHPYPSYLSAATVNPGSSPIRLMMPPSTVSHNSMMSSHLMTDTVSSNSISFVTQLKSNNPISTYDTLYRGKFMESLAESCVPLSDKSSGKEALHCKVVNMTGLGSASQDSFFNHLEPRQVFLAQNIFPPNSLNVQEIDNISLHPKDSSGALKAASPTLVQPQHPQMLNNRLMQHRNSAFLGQTIHNNNEHGFPPTSSYYNHIENVGHHPQTGQHMNIAPHILEPQMDIRSQYNIIHSPRVHTQSMPLAVSSTATLNRQSQSHLHVWQVPQHLHPCNERDSQESSCQSHTEIDSNGVNVNPATYFRLKASIIEQFIEEVKSSEETVKPSLISANLQQNDWHQQNDLHANQTDYNSNSNIVSSTKVIWPVPIDIPHSYRQTSHNAMLWADECTSGMSQTASNSSLNSESARNSVATYQSFGYNS